MNLVTQKLLPHAFKFGFFLVHLGDKFIFLIGHFLHLQILEFIVPFRKQSARYFIFPTDGNGFVMEFHKAIQFGQQGRSFLISGWRSNGFLSNSLKCIFAHLKNTDH